MATVKVVLKKNKFKAATGKYPLYLRIIEGEKNTFKSLGIDLLADEWDESKQRVKVKHPNSARMNQIIAKKISEVQDIQLENIGKKGLGKLIKKGKIKKEELSLTAYFQDYVDDLKLSGQAGTHRRVKSILKKFKDYNKQKDVLFSEFTLNYLKAYEQYLKIKKNSTNTVHSNLKVFRMLMNKAVQEDLILIQNNPFERYKLKTEKVEKVYLTEEEIKALDSVLVTSGTVMEKHRDLFTFACYAGGIRVSDLLQLRWENYDPINEKVSFFIQKTKQNHSVKLPNKAIEIIHKYRANENSKGYIFGLIDESAFGASPEDLLQKISSATAYINKNLKILAGKANIEKKLSMHISRHSMASMALKKGMNVAHLSKIMAHSNLAATMIYAKLNDESLDREMEILNS